MDNGKRELTSLVLYFSQYGSTGDIVKDSCLLCYRGIDVHRGKEGRNNRKYHLDLGAAAACTKIMIEATKGIGQKYRKGSTKDCFLFDSWLSSKKAEVSVMEVCADLIGMVNKIPKEYTRRPLIILKRILPEVPTSC